MKQRGNKRERGTAEVGGRAKKLTAASSAGSRGRASSTASDAPVLTVGVNVDNPVPHKKTPNPGYNGDNLVLVMVGLPARGKSYIAQKVSHYLSFFHGVDVKVFNAGQYRRKLFGAQKSADYFNPGNTAAEKERMTCVTAAMDDMQAWIKPGLGRIGVLDATNSTRDRRDWVMAQLAGKVAKHHVVFIESICNDAELIASNVRSVKLSMPDYAGMDKEQAAADFLRRIAEYEKVYETLADKSLSWIKCIDSGRGIHVNNIRGYLPGRIMHFVNSLHTTKRVIYLSRHGQSEYNTMGKIGVRSSFLLFAIFFCLLIHSFVCSSIPGRLRSLAAGGGLRAPPRVVREEHDPRRQPARAPVDELAAANDRDGAAHCARRAAGRVGHDAPENLARDGRALRRRVRRPHVR
jgi:hypothetical protein